MDLMNRLQITTCDSNSKWRSPTSTGILSTIFWAMFYIRGGDPAAWSEQLHLAGKASCPLHSWHAGILLGRNQTGWSWVVLVLVARNQGLHIACHIHKSRNHVWFSHDWIAGVLSKFCTFGVVLGARESQDPMKTPPSENYRWRIANSEMLRKEMRDAKRFLYKLIPPPQWRESFIKVCAQCSLAAIALYVIILVGIIMIQHW